MLRYSMFARRALWLLAFVCLPCVSARAAEPDVAKEKELIVVLQKGAPAEKALACKQLAIHGSKSAVPELEKLLADKDLASWARIALEAIPDPAADKALRSALPNVQGLLAVGVVNSIGVRRDAEAVDALSGRLKDTDAQVAAAAAVALGRVGNPAATKTLRQSLTTAPVSVRSAVAEGCVLCAERLMAEGKNKEAAEIYDEVRKADVPKPRKLEATRGAILARKTDGIPLLIEQLRSSDIKMAQIGLTAARELAGREVADALAAEMAQAKPDRAALILYALADRSDAVVSPAVLAAAKTGAKETRVAAIGLIGRAGSADSLPTLLEIGAAEDAELAQAAKGALASLPGDKINAAIAARLSDADGKTLPVLIEIVGQRRIDATPALVKSLDHADAKIRLAALVALGETVPQKELAVLVSQVLRPKNADDAPIARRALQAACVRMPDREACAAELAAAMPNASAPVKAGLVEILGSMGGPKALQTIASVMAGGDDQVQDAGSRVLGEWMTIDAGPVLLDQAKASSADKYQVRALRGYIRIARQFQMSERERAEMCQKALETARRPDEQKLVLSVLERYPSLATLKIAINARQTPALKDEAGRTAQIVAQKLMDKTPEAGEMLAKAGLEPLKFEIIKAEYGAGEKQKDVTETLRKHANELAAIKLPSGNYNDAFGGDPAPNVPKQLKVQYRLAGKTGEATFPENAPIALPMPK
ncbi:MAG TPA: HEAT repeat domain-containing protein [Pirellulales bacterium]|jgi:HEAT repeat protein